MSAFTPGPWEAEESPSRKYMSAVIFRYQSGTKGSVTLVGPDHADVGASELDEQNANARLIAAAPDLYEALKHLVRWHDQLSDEDIAEAEAALAKAGAA